MKKKKQKLEKYIDEKENRVSKTSWREKFRRPREKLRILLTLT